MKLCISKFWYHTVHTRFSTFCFFYIESSQDYGWRSTTLSFRACDDRSCRRVTIYNDVKVEQPVETFLVSLSATRTDTRIRVNTHPSTVQIMDDDGIYIYA